MASSAVIRNDDDNRNEASRYAPLLPRQRPSVSTDNGKVLSVSTNVLQQLPAGSVMAFQALSSSFTNQGECHPSNWWLSLVLVTLLTLSCIFFSFTDSFVYRGKMCYAMVFPGRLVMFNEGNQQKELRELFPELRKRRVKMTDYVRAFFSAAVFLAYAAGDLGIQNCFFPQASIHTKQLLKNMPLGMAVLSSFVFMAFPTTRKGIDFFSGGDTTAVPSLSSRTIDNIESRLQDPR
ncbi:hypothetical protein PR202_gb12057 [Eleusine coracana subsp. coracana]|uniref:Uncharacterized protein n=1 Tax=Eleusine coracana subsp. coracana TaxID=191504 RepID=A0AAV5EP41_ELECO|nr:hypothetical protein PR202_gb12057 [Eleusine coracana subsp. coracana]